MKIKNKSMLDDVKIDWDPEVILEIFSMKYAPHLFEQENDENKVIDEKAKLEQIQDTLEMIEKINVGMFEWSKRMGQKKKDVLHKMEDGIHEEELNTNPLFAEIDR